MRDDKTLIASFQAGDDQSFEELILKHRKNAISFAFKYLRDLHLAEDIVQDSFADIYVYKDRYKQKYSFKTYLYTIIRNKSIDQLRKKKPVIAQEKDIVDPKSPEICLLESEQKNMIAAKLKDLKAEYRAVLYLSQYEQLKYKDIAKIMGKNVGQIKILVYRAKKKLRQLIEMEVLE